MATRTSAQPTLTVGGRLYTGTKTWEADGWQLRAIIERDTDATPDELGYSDAAIRAWRDDAWSFVEVAVEARREGVLLATEYLCGIEDDCGEAHLADILAELEGIAIAQARRVVRRLGASLTGGGDA